MSLKADMSGKPNPSWIPHDISICRAKPSEISGLAYCLMDEYAKKCLYAEPLRDRTFCFHPRRAEIIAGTFISKS